MDEDYRKMFGIAKDEGREPTETEVMTLMRLPPKELGSLISDGFYGQALMEDEALVEFMVCEEECQEGGLQSTLQGNPRGILTNLFLSARRRKLASHPKLLVSELPRRGYSPEEVRDFIKDCGPGEKRARKEFPNFAIISHIFTPSPEVCAFRTVKEIEDMEYVIHGRREKEMEDISYAIARDFKRKFGGIDGERERTLPETVQFIMDYGIAGDKLTAAVAIAAMQAFNQHFRRRDYSVRYHDLICYPDSFHPDFRLKKSSDSQGKRVYRIEELN